MKKKGKEKGEEMTIIELFNKKANGEETPAKFTHDGYTYTENRCGMYKDEDGDDLMSNICFDFSDLNAEIEIIEDKPKHIEELDTKNIYKCDDYQQIYINFKETWKKINEIKDALNYLLDKEGK